MSSDIKTVELWQTGLDPVVIIQMKTGVWFTNQVGGTSCQHPSVEGVMIPLLWSEVPLNSEFLDDVGSDYSSERVRQFLIECGLDEQLEPDQDATEVMEAWVPVVVSENCQLSLQPFVGMKAILTYGNSD